MLEATLLSGSSDTLRTALGAAWIQNSSSTAGEQLVPYEFEDFMIGSNPYIHNMSVLDPLNAVEHIYYSAEYAQPIIKYPVRLYGSNEYVKSDDHWRKYLNGGEFQGQMYDGTFARQEFSNHLFNYSLPYTTLEAKESNLQHYGVINDIEVSYDYNYYMPKYEQYVAALDSELLMPNLYFLQMGAGIDSLDIGSEEQAYLYYDKDVLNFLTRELTGFTGYIDAISRFAAGRYEGVFMDEREWTDRDADPHYSSMAPDGSTYVTHLASTFHRYLHFDYMPFSLSGSTETAIKTKFQNIMFDHDTLESTYEEAMRNKHAMPWYTKVTFEASPGGMFANVLVKHDYSSKFLVNLKDTFGTTPTGPSLKTESFIVQETRHLNLNEETNQVYNKEFRTVDFGDLINHARLNYLAAADDFCFVGRSDKLSRQSAMDTTGIYRYINTIAATRMLASYFDFCDEDPLLESISDPYRKLELSDSTAATIISADLKAPQSQFISPNVETLAYRVEKKNSTTQEVIQNFWLSNTPALFDRSIEESIVKDIQFYDSQVKYGEEYTYDIYAYAVVVGYRYQTSDLRTTKRIADISEAGPDGPAVYCLQFHDPDTDEVRDRLFIDEGAALVTENEYATNAQITSTHKYAADFYMSVQPSLKLVEIPVTTKTLKVLDHPPNRVTATPFKVEDASKRLGFDLVYRAFEEKPFPVTINEEDRAYKADYLNANNLLESDSLVNETVSEARYMQVYRIENKPQSYEEFAGALRDTIDLRERNDLSHSRYGARTYKDHIFYDKVTTNQKYYYMFRFLNDHMNLNRESLIYEAELVDDGGYLYGIFDTFFIEDLEQPTFVKPIISFKKLLNFMPNIQHLLLDDSNVDYDARPQNQLENFEIGNKDSPIWDRKFKIRLTSKKTGKKIDLNITYNLNRYSYGNNPFGPG